MNLFLNYFYCITDEELNNWTSFEAYNVVLHEWIKALRGLGASERCQDIAMKLWVTYLHTLEVAFIELSPDRETYGEPKLSGSNARRLEYVKLVTWLSAFSAKEWLESSTNGQN